MGLAGINYHQALVLGECQVPPRGDMPYAKRLAPAQVAPTPAAESEGKGVRGRPPKSSHGHHSLGPNLLKPPALFPTPNLPQGPKIFLRTPSPPSGNPVLSQTLTAASELPGWLPFSQTHHFLSLHSPHFHLGPPDLSLRNLRPPCLPRPPFPTGF